MQQIFGSSTRQPTSLNFYKKKKDEEKPKINLFDFSNVRKGSFAPPVQQQPSGQLNIGQGVSQPGITNFQAPRQVAQQPVQQPQSSGFSMVPKAYADSGQNMFDRYMNDPSISKQGKFKMLSDIQSGKITEEDANGIITQIYGSTQEQQPEDISGLDIGVKSGEFVSKLGEKLKFEAGNELQKSSNPFVRSFGETIIEPLKFAGNVPGDSLQLIGELGKMISDPVGTTKSIKSLSQGIVESGLNKIFGQDTYTTKEKRSMVEGLNTALKENFGSLEAIQKTIIENPVDVLLTVQGGLSIAKKGITNTNKLATISKIEEAINPVNILKTEGSLVPLVGTGVKKLGASLYKTAIKPNVNEAGLILKNMAKTGPKPITRADTALKYGLTGTETKLGVKGIKEADKIFKNTVGPALDKSKVVHNIKDLFKKTEDIIKKGKSGELRKKQLLEGLEALKEDYIGIKKKFTTKDLQIEKSSLDEFTPQKIFKGKDVANGYNQVKNTFSNVLREQVRDDLGTVGIKNAKELYRDYANLTELSKIGIKGLTEGGFRGGTGTWISTLYDKLATPIKTVGGKTLYRTGQGLEFMGPKGIKTIGDYLKLKGLDIKNGVVTKIFSNKKANDSNLTDNISNINTNTTGVDLNTVKPKPINTVKPKVIKPNKFPNVKEKTVTMDSPVNKYYKLEQEAKKYKSADEFIRAQTKKEYRSAHQLNNADSITADKIDINKLKEAIRTRNGYLNNYVIKDLKKLEKLKNNPEGKITIYRASPKNELNSGDWVTTDKSYAQQIKKQNGGKLNTFEVKIKDLRFPNDMENLPSLQMATTFNYGPNINKLTDIYNKANKGIKPKKVTLEDLFNESPEDRLKFIKEQIKIIPEKIKEYRELYKKTGDIKYQSFINKKIRWLEGYKSEGIKIINNKHKGIKPKSKGIKPKVIKPKKFPNVKEKTVTMESPANKYYKTEALSDKGKDLIYKYTKSGGGTSKPMGISEQKQLSKEIIKLPKNDKTVYSGLKLSSDDLYNLKNDEWVTNRVLSSSDIKKVAEDFAEYNPEMKNKVILKINGGGHNISEYSAFQKQIMFSNENEILFPIGQKFKVDQISDLEFELTPIYNKANKPKKLTK